MPRNTKEKKNSEDTECIVNSVQLRKLFQNNKCLVFIHLHHSLDVVFFVCLSWFPLHIAGLSVGQSVPAQMEDARLQSRPVPLALGSSTGAGPGAMGALARVRGVFGGDFLTEHDNPFLQVAD